MVKVKCIWATCKYNSSEEKAVAGFCSYTGVIELTDAGLCDECKFDNDTLACSKYEYDAVKELR